MQKEVIEMCHDTRLGGHLGVNKIIDKICQRFHWYKLGNAVRNYIRKCPVCCANRHPQKRLRAIRKKNPEEKSVRSEEQMHIGEEIQHKSMMAQIGSVKSVES